MELDAQPNQPVTIQQYVILAESQRQKAALQQQQTKYHELVAENRRLQEQHDAMQKENFEVTEYLRREILAKDEKAAAQEVKVEQLERKIVDEAASAKQALQDQAVRLKHEADDRNRDQFNELVDVKEQLQVVLSFRAQQTKFQDEMERLKTENVRIQNEADDKLRAVEAANAQAAAKTRRDFDARLVEQQAANEEDLDERLSAATKRVLQHNRSLQQELRLHTEESEGLSRDLQQVVADRQRLAREVAIKAEMETQYAKRGTSQAREIREAGLKVAALERSLGQALKDADAERQVLLQRTAAQLAQAEGEGNSLRRLVRVKARELANVRRLAHEVLLQRSDVETFLVSSIRQVRDQIMRERAEGRGEATPQPIPRPGQQVDIKDLQWEDRERVLRLLFAKVNHQAKQTFYANLPAHSFKDFPGDNALHGTATKAGPAQLA